MIVNTAAGRYTNGLIALLVAVCLTGVNALA